MIGQYDTVIREIKPESVDNESRRDFKLGGGEHL